MHFYQKHEQFFKFKAGGLNMISKFKDTKIGTKLILVLLFTGIIPVAISSFVNLNKMKKSFEKEAFGKLVAMRDLKKDQITSFLEQTKLDIEIIVETVEALHHEAVLKLNQSREIKRKQIERYFTERMNNIQVFAKNPFVKQAFKDLDVALDQGGGQAGGNFKGYGNERFEAPQKYHMIHDKYFPVLKDYLTQYGYEDLFLMCPDHGDVSFSVKKKSDFGKRTRLIDSSLHDVWQSAIQSGKAEISDIKPYQPSNNTPAIFMACPIKENGNIIGVLALQISISGINQIMGVRTGLGETGETYLVGPDYLMRSDLYHEPENHSVMKSFMNPSKGKIETWSVKEALSGKTGSKDITNAFGKFVLSSYTPVKMGNVIWALIAEIHVSEALCPKNEHDRYLFDQFNAKMKYYDLFFINPTGYCFYTVAKEADYQTNLINGKYSQSNLGKLTQQVLQSKTFGIVDFAPYAPSNDDPAAFIAKPVVIDDSVEMIVALQLPTEKISSIMNKRTNMGKTGETYLVGNDNLMRSDSFHDKERHSMKASFANPSTGKVKTIASRKGLSGETDCIITKNYLGSTVLSAFTPINIWDTTTWVLISEIHSSEAFSTVEALKATSIFILIVTAILIVFLALFVAKAFKDPIIKGVDFAKQMAKGDMTGKLKIDQKDETGELAQSLNDMASSLKSMFKEIAAGIENLASSSTELSSISQQISSRSEDSAHKSTQVASATEEMSSNMASVSSAVEEASANVATVATAAEEMNATISEISQQASRAKQKAEDAVEVSTKTNERVKALGQVAKDVGSITETITEIAEQTNLLALNATIESARAGESGKGFAVVANEIKELARQTASATDEIRQQINNIQNTTASTVSEIDHIREEIQNVNDYVTSIAAAIEEQTTATQEISESVSQASAGIKDASTNVAQTSSVTKEIAKDVTDVSHAAKETNAGSSQVSNSASELNSLADKLKGMVSQFKF